jgi:hypothetical protein
VGFQFLLILDLWGISFHAVVVSGLDKNILFKSALGHCALENVSPNCEGWSSLGLRKSSFLRDFFLWDTCLFFVLVFCAKGLLVDSMESGAAMDRFSQN